MNMRKDVYLIDSEANNHMIELYLSVGAVLTFSRVDIVTLYHITHSGHFL